uniref:Uncharacterized protein n=1 Tax=Tanacetum cinerariifolium TaxID=118510 RepID=A0A699HH04_TANCI|nr:hypothetical protein [Tanacetum cinerariifolium]
MKKYESIPKRLEEDYQSIKDDTSLDYEEKYRRVEVPIIQPEPVKSTQGTYRTPRTTRTPNLDDVVQKKKRKGTPIEQENVAAIKDNILEEDVEKIVEGEDKESYGSEFDDTIFLDEEDSSNRKKPGKIRTEKMQIPISPASRSSRKDLSLDKAIAQELTVSVSPTPTTSSQRRSKSISKRYLHILRALHRICRRQEKVDEVLHDIVPKIASNATNDLTDDNLPQIVANVVKKEREASQAAIQALILQEFAVHAPKIIEELFRIHLKNTGDEALPEGEKNAKRKKTSKGSKSARGSSSNQRVRESKTSTSESQQQQEWDANTKEKRYVLSLHKIHAISFPKEYLEEKLIRLVKKEFQTFSEEARLSIQHWTYSWHKRMYKINHMKAKDNLEELFYDHRIVKVVKGTTKQQHGLDYMDQSIVMRENDIPHSYSEADFKYLNKNEFLKKASLLGSLDVMIMKAYEREIKKRLSHREQMRRWESFVNERRILQTMRRQ